jgi:hypothetical protein
MRICFPKTAYLLLIIIIISFCPNAFAYWTPEIRISEPGVCWQPRMAITGDTLHVVFVNDHGREKIDYLRSTDRGRNWTARRILSDTINTYNAYFPRILNYGRKILIVWYSIFNFGPYDHNLGYARSTDGGLTWSAPAYIFSHNKLNLAQFAAADHDSLVNLIFGDYNDTVYTFYDIKSTNFGASWQQPQEVFRGWFSSDMDMASEGNNFYYVWSGNLIDTSAEETYYLKSSDGGDTWSNLAPITPTDYNGSYWPSLSTNGQGHVVFCWTDWMYSPNWFTGDIFAKTSSDYGDTWSDPQQISFTHWESGPDIFWEADIIHTVWKTDNGGLGKIIYRRSNDDGQTWGQETRLDHDTSNSMEPQIAAYNGNVYSIFVDTRPNPDTVGWGIYFTRYLSYLPGDANNSGDVNGLDVVYLVNYFKGFGAPPVQFLSGDANGNCVVNGLDVVYLVNYLRGRGNPPVEGNCP